MILITSGAFVATEFQVEVGLLPPSLLPLGNRRLYEHQIRSLRDSFPSSQIFISITDAYELRDSDRRILDDLGVTPISVPDGLLLGDSILYAINSIGIYGDELRILHGDTYLKNFPQEVDSISVAEPQDYYAWEAESQIEDNTVADLQQVWCGFFSFADIKLLARSLAGARGSFVGAVHAYRRSRPMRPHPVIEWFDFGHVNTYFRSRAKFTTERSFNNLLIENGVVRKSSTNYAKICAEAAWFKNLPSDLKRFIPQFISHDAESEYQIEYLPLLPLNELYVHCALPLVFWRRIFRRFESLLENFRSSISLDMDAKRNIADDFENLVVEKTELRAREYFKDRGEFNKPLKYNSGVLPSLREIIGECQAAALSLPPAPGVLHGDLCFSNILYDSRADVLKIIDPRGMTVSGASTVCGDLRYDAAKFIHSIVGLYDHIVAGLFTLEKISPTEFKFIVHIDAGTAKIQNAFIQKVQLLKIDTRDFLPLVVLLFISMLPLHEDNPTRQSALFANALRIYSMWRSSL